MVRLHGEGVNWREQEVDLMALYASGGGNGCILIIYLAML
jgi:hypothetical protein